jgi:hypothetical protein
VTLENVSDEPFGFPNCPAYASGTDRRDGGGSGVLNCEPAGRLDPGERVSFEMRTRVSRHLRAGRHTLDWFLHADYGAKGVQASAEVEVEGE